MRRISSPIFMLAKRYKLPISDFLKIRGKSRLETDFFIGFYKSNAQREDRVGVTISAKIEKSAVRRHQIGRTVYELFRGTRLGGYDIHITAKKSLAAAENSEISSDIREMQQRLMHGASQKNT